MQPAQVVNLELSHLYGFYFNLLATAWISFVSLSEYNFRSTKAQAGHYQTVTQTLLAKA
jgi:hypothetical protein